MRHFALTVAIACLAGLATAGQIAFDLAEGGKVSVAVYDANGRLVRELLRGEPLSAGSHTLSWDGLDQDGAALPPGTYEWRLLRTPGFRAEYLTSLGIRPGTVPYDSWVGNHGGPAAVAVDESGIYLSATVTETAPVLLKQSLDGRQRLWTKDRGDVTRGRFQGGASLASDGEGRLYMLQQNGYIQVIGAADGQRLATWDVLPAGTARNREEGDQFVHHADVIGQMDLAARGGTVVLSDRERNRLLWLNPVDGAVAAELVIDAPGGVTVGADGHIFAIAGNRIVEATPAGVVRTVVAEGLAAPVRLAWDPTGPHLLVVEWGDRHQIHRYTLAGQHLATYGRPGGQRDGPYVATDFLQVTAIAADGQGGFVISEQSPAPRRVAHFAGDGTLRAEWYGGQPYYAYGMPDPRAPSRVWFNPGSWLTLAEIDLGSGEWRVLENYRIGVLGGGLVRTQSSHAGRWQTVIREGRCYLILEGVPQVLLHENGTLRAVSVVANDRETVETARQLAGHAEPAQSFRWLDVNGDGLPQPDEFTFAASANVPRGRSVSAAGEIVGIASGRDEGRAYVRVTLTRPEWTVHGPRYPIGDEPGIDLIAGDATVPSPAGTGGTRGVGAFRDRDGNVYAHYNTGEDWHGTTWPTYWGGQSRLVKWDVESREQWRVGRHAIHGGLGNQPHTTPPGFIHVGAAIIGEIRDTVIMADRVEWMGMVWTRDGLYVGNVLDGRVDDGLPDTVYYWWRTPAGEEAIVTSDNATGGAIVETADGQVVFFTQGRNSVPTYRIHGWDGWERQSGELTLGATAPHAARQGTGLVADYYWLPSDEEADGDAPAPFTTLAGEPAARLVEPRIWHGSPRRAAGHDTVIDGFGSGPTVDWSRGISALGDTAPDRRPPFAVRWRGQLEAPLSESFTFSIYARGGVRLWIDGRQVVFGWNLGSERWESAPLPLTAGRRYDLQVDFHSTVPYPACSLNWESFTFDRQRIATDYLYPEPPAPMTAPATRLATEALAVISFDGQSGQIEPGSVRGDTVSGLRQRAFGVSGAWIGFQRVDFGPGVSKVVVRGHGRAAGEADAFPVTVELRLDAPDGPAIAEVQLTEGEAVAEVTGAVGIRDLFLVNTTRQSWHFIGVSSLRFE